jgi:hypothetical protein
MGANTLSEACYFETPTHHTRGRSWSTPSQPRVRPRTQHTPRRTASCARCTSHISTRQLPCRHHPRPRASVREPRGASEYIPNSAQVRCRKHTTVGGTTGGATGAAAVAEENAFGANGADADESTTIGRVPSSRQLSTESAVLWPTLANYTKHHACVHTQLEVRHRRHSTRQTRTLSLSHTHTHMHTHTHTCSYTHVHTSQHTSSATPPRLRRCRWGRLGHGAPGRGLGRPSNYSLADFRASSKTAAGSRTRGRGARSRQCLARPDTPPASLVPTASVSSAIATPT